MAKHLIDFLTPFRDFEELSFVFVRGYFFALYLFYFLMSFRDFEELFFVFAPPGLIFRALSF